MNVLCMFSGGKDSFLAACYAMLEGHDVSLAFFDNGCELGTDAIRHGYARLRRRFGENRVRLIGGVPTAGVINAFKEYWMSETVSGIAAKYPELTPSQVQCIHCQSAMWCAAVALAKAKDCQAIACGYRDTDEFCTGHGDFTERWAKIAEANGLEAMFPCWKKSEWAGMDGFYRDLQMEMFGFAPCVREPRCMVGFPSKRPGPEGFACLMRYFDDAVMPKIPGMVEELEGIYLHVKLGMPAYETAAYPAIED